MIKEAIAQVVSGKDLSRDQMKAAFDCIMTGQADVAEIAAFITALRMKGESIEEITGGAEIMRKYATKVRAPGTVVLDTCGTGGDGAHTFNISTTAALVACGAGVVVAKHGNRSVSSTCGSADVLKQAGVNIEVDVGVVEQCLKDVGIGFLFAPLLHGAMKYAMPVRRQIGIRTVFNILGPLTNPAGARNQLLGVYTRDLVEPLAHVLKNLGSHHVLVVHGLDGLDEVSIRGETFIAELNEGTVTTYSINPGQFGFTAPPQGSLAGGDAGRNLAITMDILNGKPGPRRDVVLLNAGCAIYAADKAESIEKGIALAKESIDSGRARGKLEKLKQITNR